MRDVRLPKGANITVSRDDYRRATKGGGGWVIAGIVVAVIAIGSTDAPDAPTDNKPTPGNRPSATAPR